MPLAYWCVLIAALLPFVWVKIAKAGADSDNRYPREDYETLPPAKRRAYAAHQNAFESFPFFAVAVVAALVMGAPVSIVNILAVLFIALRVAHGLLYMYNQPRLRSLVFAAGMAVNIAIFALPAF